MRLGSTTADRIKTATGRLKAMPIYEYYCEACGHEFEAMQKITDKPLRRCEACGKLKAKRAISRTSFVLKGSGWYVTDYGGAKAPAPKSQPPSSTGDSDGGAKDDAKKSAPSKDTSAKKAANA